MAVGRSRSSASAAMHTHSPMRCAVSAPPMRTMPTCLGQSGSDVMWSTPAPLLRISRSPGNRASQPGAGAHTKA